MTIIASSNKENKVFVQSLHLHWRRAKRRAMHELIIMQIIIVMIITRHNKLSWNEITSSGSGGWERNTRVVALPKKRKKTLFGKWLQPEHLNTTKLEYRWEMLWNGCDTVISAKNSSGRYSQRRQYSFKKCV